MLPKSLRSLLPYFKKYRLGYVVGTVCVFLNNGIWILPPLVIGHAIDDLHLGVTRHKLFTYAIHRLSALYREGREEFAKDAKAGFAADSSNTST